MHILLIHQAFATTDEAGGTRHYELARHLVRKGHRATVVASTLSYLTGQATGSERQSNGPEVRRACTYPGLHRSFVTRVISFLSFMLSSFVTSLGVKDVDVVWGTSPPIFQGLTAWLVARLKGAPFVFEVRDLWPDFAIDVSVLRNPLLIRASRGLERFLYRRADHLIVNSPAYIEHVCGKGIQDDRVTLVPNGVETAMFDPEANGAELRREIGLDRCFVVMYVGAHGMANDLGVLLQAADLLRDRTDIAFVLVGDGKERPNLMHQAEEMALPNVRFIPAQPKARMPEFLAAADAGVALLKDIPMFNKTFPNKVFDYMAAGRPTVLAIDGVIREVVEAAGGGIFVSPGDSVALASAVQELAADQERCRSMGQSARTYVEENFERARHAEKLETLLRELLES